MKFFFDRCLAPHLARGLAGFWERDEIVHLDDDRRFKNDAKDTDIIAALSAERPKPVFVTADFNMAWRDSKERLALRGSGLHVVFFKKGFHSLPFDTQASKITRIWPDIREAVAKRRVPTAFEVTPKGTTVKPIGPTAQL